MADTIISHLKAGWTLDVFGYVALATTFIICGLLPVPRTLLSLASGFVFGLSAVVVVALASTAGGMVAFVIARYVLRQRVRRVLSRQRHVAAILHAVDLEGWRVIALMRFYGPVPTTVQNYAFGLTSIGLWSFAVTTLIFSTPQIILYCYLGSLGRSTLTGGFAAATAGAIPYATAVIAFLCLSAIVMIVGRRVRCILAAGTDEAEPGGTSRSGGEAQGDGRHQFGRSRAWDSGTRARGGLAGIPPRSGTRRPPHAPGTGG